VVVVALCPHDTCFMGRHQEGGQAAAHLHFSRHPTPHCGFYKLICLSTHCCCCCCQVPGPCECSTHPGWCGPAWTSPLHSEWVWWWRVRVCGLNTVVLCSEAGGLPAALACLSSGRGLLEQA
jgi:hypothetical protein